MAAPCSRSHFLAASAIRGLSSELDEFVDLASEGWPSATVQFPRRSLTFSVFLLLRPVTDIPGTLPDLDVASFTILHSSDTFVIFFIPNRARKPEINNNLIVIRKSSKNKKFRGDCL